MLLHLHFKPLPKGHSSSVPGDPSLSRLLQEAELFKLHTQELTAPFPLSSAHKSLAVPVFSEHRFYKLNKLYGTVIPRQPRPGNSMPEHSQALQAPADTGEVHFTPNLRTSSSYWPAPSALKHLLPLRAFNLACPNTPQELEGTHQDH